MTTELRETFTPTLSEVAWAQVKTRSDQHLFALVVWLKAYGRLGYFPDLFEVPLSIVDHIRRHLELKPEIEPAHDSDRTAERHREWVRDRLGVTYDSPAARALADRVIREAALTTCGSMTCALCSGPSYLQIMVTAWAGPGRHPPTFRFRRFGPA